MDVFNPGWLSSCVIDPRYFLCYLFWYLTCCDLSVSLKFAVFLSDVVFLSYLCVHMSLGGAIVLVGRCSDSIHMQPLLLCC
jgi:hypothetical protein